MRYSGCALASPAWPSCTPSTKILPLAAHQIAKTAALSRCRGHPWCAEPRVIASIDYIKRREGAFRELSASRWDVIIIDEAHHLASGGGDEDLTDRYRLARWLAAENTGALLLLTATPHDGYDENFASLLSLLEPSLVIPGRELRFDQYRQHMVRRLKRHIRLPNGEPKFVERLPVRPIPVRFSPAELRVQQAVHKEADSLDELAEQALKADRESIRLVAVVLRKRAASSFAALRKTILQRKENLAETLAEIELRREHLRAWRRGEPIPEEAQARLERDLYRSYLSAMQRTGRVLRRLREEEERIEELQALVDTCGTGPESKLVELEKYLKSLHATDGSTKVIVFSEYADTVDVIVEYLEQVGYAGRLVKLTGDVTSRKDRRAALARFASPDALILVATDIAGEGLNLHECCHHLVHFELPWNPNRLEQRNGRIDRYGQTKPPAIAYLYAADSYEGEVLSRLVQKIEAQLKKLGSVGDVLGQIQADRIEELLRRPVSDLRQAIAEAEGQIDNELNRAVDPRIRRQIGEGGDTSEDSERAEAAIRQEQEQGVALDVFLQRAVNAAGGTVERTGTAWRVLTPHAWRNSDVQPLYEKLLPPGSYLPGEEYSPNEVLHEEHPLLQAALRWVRASRFRADDDHRLACVAVSSLEEPELIATFLTTLQDGTGAQVQRFEAVRVTQKLEVSRNASADDAATRESHSGNVPSDLLGRLFGDWWQEARRLAENEAQRRAVGWKQSLVAFRGLERQLRKSEIDRWDEATKEAILGDYRRQLEQGQLFATQRTMPSSIRRRLEDHRKRAELQRAILDRRMRFGDPAIEPLGVLLRVPTSLIQEGR